MVNRKIGTVFTTISILWEDKNEFRKFAKLVKKTKNGDMHESDSALFKRMLTTFKAHEKQESTVPTNTYPKKTVASAQPNPSQEQNLQG